MQSSRQGGAAGGLPESRARRHFALKGLAFALTDSLSSDFASMRPMTTLPAFCPAAARAAPRVRRSNQRRTLCLKRMAVSGHCRAPRLNPTATRITRTHNSNHTRIRLFALVERCLLLQQHLARNQCKPRYPHDRIPPFLSASATGGIGLCTFLLRNKLIFGALSFRSLDTARVLILRSSHTFRSSVADLLLSVAQRSSSCGAHLL